MGEVTAYTPQRNKYKIKEGSCKMASEIFQRTDINPISIDEYQQFALSTADPCAKSPLYLACGLCEEAVEEARKMKKTFRDNNGVFEYERNQNVALELSDVMWYMANLAHQMGYKLSEIAELNRDKVQDRINRRVLHGSGDNR